MKKSFFKSIAAMLMIGILAFESLSIMDIQRITTYAYTEKSATVKATSLNVRSGPGTTYSKVTSLPHGTKVTITDETTASDGSTWYAIRFAGSTGSQITGYAAKAYLKEASSYVSDGSFEQQLSNQGFPESYKIYLREIHSEYPNWVFTAQKTGLDWEEVISNESVVGRNLVYKTSISSWKSIADGAYDWNTSSWPGFDSSSWVAASEEIIRYYMDPRNFLDSTYVFQFLDQEYDASAHNAAGVETLVKGTFMESTASAVVDESTSPSVEESGPSAVEETTPAATEESTVTTETTSENTSETVALVGPGVGDVPKASSPNNQGSSTAVSEIGPGINNGSGNTDTNGQSPTAGSKSYVDIIMSAASQSGVNPYVLAAMIIQEQGTQGTSGLISGSNSSYPGIYNFFNIEAYQSGSTGAVARGLWWASQSGSYGRPWNSVEAAITGGAKYYGENYVNSGQDTFYLKKFNVNGSNIYKHQYMTNIQGAAGEGAKLSQAYSEELKNTALNFKIPVYNNMPENLMACPTIDGSPNNKLSSLTVEGFSLTPSYSRDTQSYDLIVDNEVSEVKVGATAIDNTASISGTGNINLSDGINTIEVSVTAQNGDVRIYKLNIVRHDNGPTYSGSGNGSTYSESGNSSYGPGYTNTIPESNTESTTPTETSAQDSTGTAVLIGPSGN